MAGNVSVGGAILKATRSFIAAVAFMLCLEQYSFSQEISWISTGGPQGGSVSSLFLYRNVLLAGTFTGGVFRSTDKGISWRQTALSFGNVRDLTVTDGGEFVAAVINKGIYVSRDSGLTWQYKTFLTSFVYALGTNSKGHIFAGAGPTIFQGNSISSSKTSDTSGYPGVYRSTDGGETWNLVGLKSINVYSLAVDSNQFIFAGTYQRGIHKSTDNGLTWSLSGLADSTIDALAIANSRNIFAATRSGCIYQSSDGGLGWQKLSQLNPPIYRIISNALGELFAIANESVFRSSDSGKIWTPIYLGSVKVHSIASGNEGFVSIGALDEGIYLSDDNGKTWRTSNQGFSNTRILSMGEYPQTPIFAGTQAHGLFYTTDTGTSWNRSSLQEKTINAIYLPSKEKIIIGSSKNIYLSTNAGIAWEQASSLAGTVTLFKKDEQGRIYAGSTSGIYQSSDTGKSWNRLGLENLAVRSMAINKSGYLFAGVSPGGILKSTDRGATWNVSSPYFDETNTIETVGDNTILAGVTFGVIILSTDTGKTWKQISLPNVQRVNLIRADALGRIFAATAGRGILLSNDTGKTWIDIGNGLTQNEITTLGFGSLGHIFAGTIGNGIYRSLNPIITSIEEPESNLPVNFELLQNYPNPFNSETKITFKIPRNGFVSLKVFDVLGREVAVLVNEFKNAGAYQSTFNASSLPSGMYLYKLEAAGKSIIQKMILMK